MPQSRICGVEAATASRPLAGDTPPQPCRCLALGARGCVFACRACKVGTVVWLAEAIAAVVVGVGSRTFRLGPAGGM